MGYSAAAAGAIVVCERVDDKALLGGEPNAEAPLHRLFWSDQQPADEVRTSWCEVCWVRNGYRTQKQQRTLSRELGHLLTSIFTLTATNGPLLPKHSNCDMMQMVLPYTAYPVT